MSISVLFFGATAAITGNRRIERCADADVKAVQVFKEILNEYPQLAAHKLHLAINQQYATGDEIVRDGDELAIFTAVSGG